MNKKINVVLAGYSTFNWELASQLRERVGGRLYLVLSERERAVEAGLMDGVVAVHGDLTETEVLDQLDLAHCHTFIAASREDQDNILAALYAKNAGVQHVYARTFEDKFTALLESLGVTPLQTSHIAAGWMAVRILEPAVAELVSLTHGEFDLAEIEAAQYPELIGCRLGNLQGEHLHIIAVAQKGEVYLSYTTVITPEAKLILIYNQRVKPRLQQELRQVAARAAKHSRQM